MNDEFVEQYINQIGEELLRVRKEKKLSQQELSHECGIEKPYIRNIEKGRTNPTIKTLLRICHSLNISLSDLIKNVEKAYQ